MISPQPEEELNKSTGVGGENGDLETDGWSVSGSVAGVVTVGTSGEFTGLGNWETTTLETCLNEGVKGSSLGEGKPNETILPEGSGEVALSGVVALSNKVALSEGAAPAEEAKGTNRAE